MMAALDVDQTDSVRFTTLGDANPLQVEGHHSNLTLFERETAMREQIRRLQEQRALAMREEIDELQAAKQLATERIQLLEAQLMESKRQVDMLRRRLRESGATEQVCEKKVRLAEEEAARERVEGEEMKRKLKAASQQNGLLLLKLKKLEQSNDERGQQLVKQLKQCNCLQCPEHSKHFDGHELKIPEHVRLALTEARQTIIDLRQHTRQLETSLAGEQRSRKEAEERLSSQRDQIQSLRNSVAIVSSTLADWRNSSQKKLSALEDELEAAKVIYSLHNSLSQEQDSLQEMASKLERRTQALADVQAESRYLRDQLDKAKRLIAQYQRGTSSSSSKHHRQRS